MIFQSLCRLSQFSGEFSDPDKMGEIAAVLYPLYFKCANMTWHFIYIITLLIFLSNISLLAAMTVHSL